MNMPRKINGDTVTDTKSTHITLTEVKIKNRHPIRPVTTYPIYKNMYNTGLSNDFNITNSGYAHNRRISAENVR